MQAAEQPLSSFELWALDHNGVAGGCLRRRVARLIGMLDDDRVNGEGFHGCGHCKAAGNE